MSGFTTQVEEKRITVFKADISVRDPITKNQTIELRCNSVRLRNVGNVRAAFDGNYTIFENGGTEEIGIEAPHIIEGNHTIKFIEGGEKNPGEPGAVQRIEWVQIVTKTAAHAHQYETGR